MRRDSSVRLTSGACVGSATGAVIEDRITLDRIDRQALAQRAHQQRAVATQAKYVSIGSQCTGTAFTVADFHPLDQAVAAAQPFDCCAEMEGDAFLS